MPGNQSRMIVIWKIIYIQQSHEEYNKGDRGKKFTALVIDRKDATGFKVIWTRRNSTKIKFRVWKRSQWLVVRKDLT